MKPINLRKMTGDDDTRKALDLAEEQLLRIVAGKTLNMRMVVAAYDAVREVRERDTSYDDEQAVRS